MIRVFVAVPIAPDMCQRISAAQTQLKGSLAGIRWVVRENLHWTLKFLGAVSEETVEPIVKRLESALQAFAAFPIAGRGLGVFPDIRRARVLWVGLEGEGLSSLAFEVEAALEPIGFAREKRVLKPHLTIGRWRSFNGKTEQLKEQMVRWKDHDFGLSWVEEVILFQSVLRPEGALYSPLQVIRLNKQVTSASGA